jgi:hypothetical protein
MSRVWTCGNPRTGSFHVASWHVRTSPPLDVTNAMTNVLARSSAKQGSTKRLKGIAMLPVDGVKLREPLGPDKARLAAIERHADRGLPECSQQRRIRSTPASKTRWA